MPELSIEHLSEFPASVEAYINDHLPFRNQMIRLNSAIGYYIFHSPSDTSVSIGKEGWLFYNNINNGDPIALYKGEHLLTAEELEIIADNMVRTRENLSKEGCEFVLFIAPNKERIYSEYMQDYYGEPAEEYQAKQIVDYLKAHTDVRVVYPYDELMQAKEKLGEDALLYRMTDTHWNELGAYIGTCALMKELGIELPEYDSSELTIHTQDDTPGDLSGMLNISTIINPGRANTISGYEFGNMVVEKREDATEYIYHNQGADSRKIFIRRDSFCSAMAGFIGAQFEDSYMMHSGIYTNDAVKEQKPDVFVLETVEQYASQLLTFQYE